jgi:hypothetical protein
MAPALAEVTWIISMVILHFSLPYGRMMKFRVGTSSFARN